MTNIKRWIWALVPVSFALLFIAVWLNLYAVFDWYVLRSYTPASEVVQIATSSGMSKEGKNIFYAHAPKLTDKDEFNAVCTHSEETIVLGCYTGFDFNKDPDIFIYNVTKPELEGIKEVTAAHEMLHAAYERLSSKEQQKVDEMVLTMYQKVNNPRVTKLVEGYQKQNPGDSALIANELHSILATEVANLDAELEQYYSKYFVDRAKVVALSEKYESVFTSKEAEAERLSGEVNLRKSEIEQLKTSLTAQNDELETIANRMNGYLNSGNTGAYNTLVPTYNQKANEYNADLAKINALIDDTNNLISQLNENAVQQQELINSIDSQHQSTD